MDSVPDKAISPTEEPRSETTTAPLVKAGSPVPVSARVMGNVCPGYLHYSDALQQTPYNVLNPLHLTIQHHNTTT